MTIKRISVILLVLVLLGSLAGCAAKSTGSVGDDYYISEDADAGEGFYGEMVESSSVDTTAMKDRKLIKTVELNVETEDLDAVLAALTDRINALGGYVESQQVYNGSSYSNHRSRNANLTIRIPAEKLDAFVQEVSGTTNIVSQYSYIDDVTLTYVATESRVEALQAEEKRLLELMDQAETMADLLEVEARLTDVRYELESVTTQLNVLANQVNYSTVELSVDEVKEYTPVEEETFWQRISGGFMDSLRGVGDGIVEFTVFVLANLPYLVLLAAAVTVLVLIIRHRRRKKKAKKAQEQQ